MRAIGFVGALVPAFQLTLFEKEEKMQLVGKSKVTRLNAKTGITYPLIRLPKAFANEIGRIAEMYEIEKGSSRTLLVTFPKSFESKEVIQPKPKVIQLDCQKEVEERLLELESEINTLKSLLFLNESAKSLKIKNRWARGDSNARPSPCKGDVIIDKIQR